MAGLVQFGKQKIYILFFFKAESRKRFSSLVTLKGKNKEKRINQPSHQGNTLTEEWHLPSECFPPTETASLIPPYQVHLEMLGKKCRFLGSTHHLHSLYLRMWRICSFHQYQAIRLHIKSLGTRSAEKGYETNLSTCGTVGTAVV